MRHCFQTTFKMEGRRISNERATAICSRWLLVNSHSAAVERLAGGWRKEDILLADEAKRSIRITN